VDDDREIRRARLRDPRTYATVGEWYNDYRGFVSIQCAHALSRVIQARGMTFADAYDDLVRRGTIIEIGPVPPRGPDPSDPPPAAAAPEGTPMRDVKRNRIVRMAVA
jgi:hypothetical protein